MASRFIEAFEADSARAVSLNIVMEFVEGASLNHYHGRPVKPEIAIELGRRLLRILADLRCHVPPVLAYAWARSVRRKLLDVFKNGSRTTAQLTSVRGSPLITYSYAFEVLGRG